MKKKLLLAVGLLCAGGLVISVQRVPDGAGAIRPLVELSPAKLATLQKKARKLAGRRFGDPDLAQQFYVNSRTGPIITRGPNPTAGVRPLSPSIYFPAMGQMRNMPRSSAAGSSMRLAANATAGDALDTWTSLGPANQGGRTRALIIDPTDPNIMYAGGVDGGVWKSTDGGANWTAASDLMGNIAVVTLAFDPQNSSVIYAGTGEGFFNVDAIRGAGIFRSTDAGATWNQLASTNNSNFFYTMKILVSPRNSQRLWAATRAGVFRSLDAGATWAIVLSGTAVNGCTDMAMQVTGAAGYVFASCGNFVQGTVYRADDADASTFASVLSLAGQGRSSIAVAPSDESVVYVLAAQYNNGPGPGADGLHGVYRSSANGDPGTFVTQRQGNVAPANDAQKLNQLLLSNPVFGFAQCVGPGSDGYYNQGWYDNVIAVDPADANRVWAGGIDLWRSDNGGVDWGTGGYWWFGKGTEPQYHHADQHGIVFHPHYNGTSNKVMFSASDGGVERIDDAHAPVNTTVAQLCGVPVAGGPTWVDRNNGYVTTQFYDGAVYPDGQSYFGGLQDNGTQRGTSASPNWTILLGGDGGYTAVDTLSDANPGNDVLFAEYTGLSLQKSTNGGTSFFDAITGINDQGFPFIAAFTMNEAFKQHLWVGGWYVWRTTNQAASWSRASAITCGNGSISAVATHPLDANRVLVGMSDGCYHYNHAALSGTSTTVWASGAFGTSYISGMAWDPSDVNVAYATISRFGGTNLFKSTNGGVTWAPSVGTGVTALPQIPARSVVVHPTDSQQVFVGTDLGVFSSPDAGANWYVENTGFANVSVNALKFDATATPALYAFTHGRGAWKVGGAPVKVATTTVVTFEAGPYVYRGSAFTANATVTGGTLNEAVAVVYSGDCTNVTVPNGCTATATFAETVDYLGSTDSKSITITTAPVTATAGSGTAVYDGAQHSPPACDVSGTFTSGVSCVNSPASVGPGGGTAIITPLTSGAGSNFLVTPVNGSFTITPAITPVSINNLPNQPSFGSSFTPTYAYLGDGVTSASSNTPATCIVSGATVQFVGAGTCTLTAHATATPNYQTATGPPQSIEIGKASPTISINNIPVGAVYGGSFTPAYAYLGDGVTSVSSNTPATCIVSGATVQFVGAGTCTLTAHATATANYQAATGPPQSIAIGKASPTISINNIPVGAVYGGSFTPTFAYTGNGTTFATSSTLATCWVVSGGRIKFVGVGTCTLIARATATTNVTAATGTAQSFVIGQATPTIKISNIPTDPTHRGRFTPSYTYTGDGLTSVTSSTPETCSVVGTAVKLLRSGMCTLRAHATATTNFAAATGLPQSFLIKEPGNKGGV